MEKSFEQIFFIWLHKKFDLGILKESEDGDEKLFF